MKKVLYILFLLLIALGFTTCKKYPEDPKGIEWHTVKKRIQGIWEPYEYTVDGVDSLALLKASPCYGLYSFTCRNGKNYAAIVTPVTFQPVCQQQGEWSIKDRKEKLFVSLTLHIIYDNPMPYSILGYPGKTTRLDNKELWVEFYYVNKFYYIKFKRIRDDGI